MTLLKMSFYGAVIILAILIIRAFTLHKLPKKTFLILWAVALVRLLVPFEIASGFSLYSLLPEELTPQENQTTGAPNTENPYAPFENYYDYLEHQKQVSSGQDDTTIVGENGGLIYLPTDPPDGEIVPLPDVDEEVLPAIGNTDTEQPDSSLTILELWNNLRPHLPVLWGIGTLLCACFFLVSYLRCRLEFSTSLPVTEDYAAEWLVQHPLKRTVTIRQSDKISAPLTYGIFRPVILMPKKTDWNNHTQLDYVLYHEFTHIRRFDLLAKLVTIAALCLHWFNPCVWLMYFFFNRDLELSCDDCVVKHFNEAKSAYANTLIGMEEKKNYSTPLCNHFSKNAIEERITAIMKSKKTTIGMMVAAIVIVILVVVTLTTGRKDKEAASDLTPTPPENSDSSVMTEYEEVLTPRIEEYLTMMNSCFLNNPPIAGEATPENAVSINDNTGFYPVDEEAFPSYDALIDYVQSICTEKHADELCRRYWLLDYNVLPNIGVLSGKAYTKLFQSTTYPERFEITDIKENIKPYDDTTLSATIRFTEGTNPYYWGVLTFAKQEDTWYIADVTLHRHPMEVSPTPTTSPLERHDELPPWSDEEYNLDLDLFSELIINYHTMHGELFRSGPDCGMHSYTPAQPVTINGVDHYYKVVDERFLTMQSVINYMETICTPAYAETLRNHYLRLNSDVPLLAEINGVLYTQYYSSSTWNDPSSFRFTDITIVDSNHVRVGYQGYNNSLINVRVSGTIDFVSDNGWRIDSITTNWGNPYFDTYNGETLQILKCTETGYASLNGCNDIIFYRAEAGETIETALTAMTTNFDVKIEQPYQQIDMFAWRIPFSAQGSEEVFYFILLKTGDDGVYRLQWEEAAKGMLDGSLTYYNPLYEEMAASGSIPTTDGPDWYNAVSELMHGNTPKNTTEAEQSFHANHGDLKCIQPSNENGHVFTISNLVLWEEKNVILKDVSLDLSTYTTSFIWRENGIYYNEPDGEIYIVFSPTLDEAKGGTGMVEYQVLLATIPQVGSENYTIRCYGNPESPLDLGGSHTYGTTKIGNLIYLGESCHGDTFYTIDTNTKELTSLSYVNDALYAQAKSYLTECGLGTEFALSSHVVCKAEGCTIFSADISSSVDNSPTYFTVYHAYIGSDLLGKVILRHLIPFYDAINESHVNAMYINMDDVVTMAKEQFEAFYESKGYAQPYKITSIHMTSFESIEVEFLISESDNFDIYTEAEVDFTYNFEKELWEVSRFREIPPDYLSSHTSFPRLTEKDVTVTGKDWCLTYVDELTLPRYQELANADAKATAEESTYLDIGHWYTLSLNGISYFFYRENAPINNDEAFAIAITSPEYPLSGGAKVGMTVEELLTLYPTLAKTELVNEDPVFEAKYGPTMYSFRADQFPPAFLNEYEYAYIALTEKDYPGLPICIAFLIKDDVVSAITEYMPTAN